MYGTIFLGCELIRQGAACLYYHMSKILILECLLERFDDINDTETIQFHAREIASISLLSDLPDSAMVVAVNPVFYGASHTSQVKINLYAY